MTLSSSRGASMVRDVPYGSETLLIVGEPAEGGAFCREALRRCGYDVLEAANFQHADTVLEYLESGPDLILVCTGSDREDALAIWCRQHRTWPLLVLNPEDCRRTPDICDGEIALKVRLALEAARPSRRILIVDEDEPERRMLAHLLETAGYQVNEASNGKEARRLLATNKPELLLTDIVMHEIDGLELIQDVRKHHPEIAAIAMSGTDRADQYLSVARLLGAKGVLKKPLSIDHLFKLLREVQHQATN